MKMIGNALSNSHRFPDVHHNIMLTLVYMDARADALHVDVWCLDVDALCVGLNALRAMRMKKEGKKS